MVGAPPPTIFLSPPRASRSICANVASELLPEPPVPPGPCSSTVWSDCPSQFVLSPPSVWPWLLGPVPPAPSVLSCVHSSLSQGSPVPLSDSVRPSFTVSRSPLWTDPSSLSQLHSDLRSPPPHQSGPRLPHPPPVSPPSRAPPMRSPSAPRLPRLVPAHVPPAADARPFSPRSRAPAPACSGPDLPRGLLGLGVAGADPDGGGGSGGQQGSEQRQGAGAAARWRGRLRGGAGAGRPALARPGPAHGCGWRRLRAAPNAKERGGAGGGAGRWQGPCGGRWVPASRHGPRPGRGRLHRSAQGLSASMR